MKLKLFLICLVLIGCSDSKTDFKIKLTAQEGYGTFIPGMAIVWPADDALVYRNIPGDIDEYVVRSLPLLKDPNQIEGNIDCEVLILIGTRSGKRIIMVDSDNDEDFGDEEIFEYEYPISIESQKAVADMLPKSIVQFEYIENGKKSVRKAAIQPSPYKGAMVLSFDTENHLEKEYSLFARFPEHKKGNFNFDGTNYEVFVSNGFTGVAYSAGRSSVFIHAESDPPLSELNGAIPYRPGDVFNIKGHDYLIDSVSIWGDELFIKYIGENIRPVGISEGYYMPPFEAKRLDNSVFELKLHPDKYVLLDFWGTWCKPCIELIPELKKINSTYPKDKFVLVSVAYDSDPEKVSDFIKKEGMDWEHIFVNQSLKNNNSLVEKLKIQSYPTTILIDPEGRIMARNSDFEKLNQLLRKKLIAL